MVGRKDVASVLSSLAAAGFDTDVTDSTWLAKGYRDGVVIDLISRIGNIYFDDELAAHVVTKRYLGLLVSVVAAEDLLIMKLHCHTMKMPGYGSESMPRDINYDRHWRDALAIIETTALDCDYLLERSRLAPHVLLSLLAYAQALGLAVPDRACVTLAQRLYSVGQD